MIYEIYKGEISITIGPSSRSEASKPRFAVRRAERPVYYWFLVGGEAVIALLLLTGIFSF